MNAMATDVVLQFYAGMASSGLPVSRRHLLQQYTDGGSTPSATPSSYNLTDITLLKALVSSAADAMAAAAAAAGGNSSSGSGGASVSAVEGGSGNTSAVVTPQDAAYQAVSNLLTLLQTLRDPVSLAQAVFMGSQALSDLLLNLLLGSLSVEAFVNTTSNAAILRTAQETALPGQLVPSSCTGGKVGQDSCACIE